MAYDAAVSAGVDAFLVDLYVASCVKFDSSWYVEKMGLSLSPRYTRRKGFSSPDIVFVWSRSFAWWSVSRTIPTSVYAVSLWFSLKQIIHSLVSMGNNSFPPESISGLRTG